MLRCKSSLHTWETEGEAARCCNGWTFVWVPLGYGERYTGKQSFEVSKAQKLWKPCLIQDSNVAEIQRILESTPPGIIDQKQ